MTEGSSVPAISISVLTLRPPPSRTCLRPTPRRCSPSPRRFSSSIGTGLNLCAKELVDPRGQRVRFLDTDFVHLVKLH